MNFSILGGKVVLGVLPFSKRRSGSRKIKLYAKTPTCLVVLVHRFFH